jgi:hypothetical protein
LTDSETKKLLLVVIRKGIEKAVMELDHALKLIYVAGRVLWLKVGNSHFCGRSS